uniref:Uncharacterized protein n=1 Tax=Sphaerodactylus townsendi TaxID=933632 RepID=A0ACB8EKJ4_9SAUR
MAQCSHPLDMWRDLPSHSGICQLTLLLGKYHCNIIFPGMVVEKALSDEFLSSPQLFMAQDPHQEDGRHVYTRNQEVAAGFGLSVVACSKWGLPQVVHLIINPRHAQYVIGLQSSVASTARNLPDVGIDCRGLCACVYIFQWAETDPGWQPGLCCRDAAAGHLFKGPAAPI